jgi:hypothetical protein
MLQSLQLSGTRKTVALSFSLPAEILDNVPKGPGGSRGAVAGPDLKPAPWAPKPPAPPAAPQPDR